MQTPEQAMLELIELAAPRTLTFMLVSVRIGIVFSASPWPGRLVPMQIKSLIAITFALLITSTLPESAIVTASGAALVGIVIGEIAYGAALVTAIWLSVTALATCGQIAGMQMGFGLRGTMDPASGSSMNAVARIAAMAWMPMALEFGMLDHLLRAMALPPTVLYPAESIGLIERAAVLADAVLMGSGHMFALAFVGAGPVFAMGMISHAGLGAITRAVPNAMIIGEALGGAALLGMVAVGLSARSWPDITLKTLEPLRGVLGG